MKALIIGTGAQGSVIAGEIVKDADVSEVILSDIDLGRAERLAQSLKSDKVCVRHVDATDIDAMVKVGGNVDIVMNATLPKFNLNIMEAALKIGAHYADMASYPSEQLALSNKWKEGDLTALISCGASPGVTNILAAHAADRLDRVEKIRVLFGSKLIREAEEYVPTWSPETAWTDMAMEPIVYTDGESKTVPPFSGEEVYPFPEPVGPQTVYWHAHEEPETLPLFLDKTVRFVDFKMGGPDFPFAKTVFKLGLLDDKPREVKGVKMAPIDMFLSLLPSTLSPEEMEIKRKAGVLGEKAFCMIVEVHGEKEGERLSYTAYRVTKTMPEAPRVPLTGTAASIFALMLGKGKIKTKGVIPPEGLEPAIRQAVLVELAKYGVVFTERVEHPVA